jgi:hypothetical protein
MALPLIAAGVAARAVAKKVATNAAKKAATKAAKTAAQKSKTAKVAKNSVKVTPGSSISKTRAKNVTEYNTNIVNRRKSGELAKSVAKSKTPPRENLMFPPDKVKINSASKNSKTATKSNYKTTSLAKTQARGVAILAGAGVATGEFTLITAVKQSIKRQVEEANKNKKKKK